MEEEVINKIIKFVVDNFKADDLITLEKFKDVLDEEVDNYRNYIKNIYL